MDNAYKIETPTNSNILSAFLTREERRDRVMAIRVKLNLGMSERPTEENHPDMMDGFFQCSHRIIVTSEGLQALLVNLEDYITSGEELTQASIDNVSTSLTHTLMMRGYGFFKDELDDPKIAIYLEDNEMVTFDEEGGQFIKSNCVEN